MLDSLNLLFSMSFPTSFLLKQIISPSKTTKPPIRATRRENCVVLVLIFQVNFQRDKKRKEKREGPKYQRDVVPENLPIAARVRIKP